MKAVFGLCGRRTFAHLRALREQEYLRPERLRDIQERDLGLMLVHAWRHVPYYRQVLADCGAVRDGRAILENFSRIPPLTKDVLRQQGDALLSDDYHGRKWYHNTSGGSTGEPVRLVQDRAYKDWGFACRFYFNEMVGKKVGEPELQLWGSERDIFHGSENLRTRVEHWGFNRCLLNSFAMTDATMAGYVDRWNRFQPLLVWAYTSSIHEFARYLERTGREIRPPRAIVVTAETLTEEVRRYVEGVIGCPVLNQYGSREVGAIGCECDRKQGLHVFNTLLRLEVLDETLAPCAPGRMGALYVTPLTNFSMPLIRYGIGDTAVAAGERVCGCGRGWPLLGAVTGRTSDHFRARGGKIVHGEYFTHLFYDQPKVRQFRVIQHGYEDVEVMVQPPGSLSVSGRADVEQKIRLVMGEECRLQFTEVEDIPRLSSGKYRYTVSEVGA
jgi:phenylacetate-CoA ligase